MKRRELIASRRQDAPDQESAIGQLEVSAGKPSRPSGCPASTRQDIIATELTFASPFAADAPITSPGDFVAATATAASAVGASESTKTPANVHFPERAQHDDFRCHLQGPDARQSFDNSGNRHGCTRIPRRDYEASIREEIS